jgi:Beta-lactamase
VDVFRDRTIADLDDRKKAITIQNLLDMTSGLNWTEPLGDGQPLSMLGMERSPDWVKFVLDQPMAASPGTTFNYSSGNAHLLSAILTKATGESALDYARQRLFGPLGISDVFWRQDPQGISMGGYGLFLHPRDMAKLGYLYLRNGLWDGAEIIPPEWVERIRHATIPMGIANLRYANLFWVDPGSGVFFASGFHGQRMFVAPALDIVGVVTATGTSASSSALIEQIANAVKSDGLLPPNLAAQSLLASRIGEAETEKPSPVGQTPDIARTISGKVYHFADNPVGLDSLTLTLDGPNRSYAYALKPTRPDAPAERFEAPIGLDGRYRTGPPRPDGTIPAAKGGWSYDGSFVIQSGDIGGDNLRKAILSFKDKSVDVMVMPEDGPSVELHGEVRD